MGGSERGTWAAPPPRRVLVPYGSQAPSAPVLEVWKKAASRGLTRLREPPGVLLAPSRKLLPREDTATSSASRPPHKQLTCKGI